MIIQLLLPRPVPQPLIEGKEKEEKSERSKVAYLPTLQGSETRTVAIQVHSYSSVIRFVWILTHDATASRGDDSGVGGMQH